MRGHEGRVFSVAWSPLLPHLVFSAAEDQSARSWDYTSQPDQVPPGIHEWNDRRRGEGRMGGWEMGRRGEDGENGEDGER